MQLNGFGGSYGNPFAGAVGGYRQGVTNPFASPPAGGFDRNLMEESEGRPALGYYAVASGANAPFKDWLETAATHAKLWNEYGGAYAQKNSPAYSFTDYLRENDPYQRYAAMSPQDRGETPQSAFSPFVQLLNL